MTDDGRNDMSGSMMKGATTNGGADDPRLTAYALGELDGRMHDADRAAVESILADGGPAGDAARRLVDDVRVTAGALAAAYSGLPAPATLDATQRETIRASAASVQTAPTAAPAASAHPGTVLRVSKWRVPVTMAAAAVVAAAFAMNRGAGGGGVVEIAQVEETSAPSPTEPPPATAEGARAPESKDGSASPVATWGGTGGAGGGPTAGGTGSGQAPLPLAPNGPHRPAARDSLPDIAAKPPSGPGRAGGLGGLGGRMAGPDERVPSSDPATSPPSAGPGARLADALQRETAGRDRETESIERLRALGYIGSGRDGGVRIPGATPAGGNAPPPRPETATGVHAFGRGPAHDLPILGSDAFAGVAGDRPKSITALDFRLGDELGPVTAASWGTDAANPANLAGFAQTLVPKPGTVDGALLLKNIQSKLPGAAPAIDLPTVQVLLTTADGGDAALRTSLIQGGLLSPQPASNGYHVLTLGNGAVFAPQVLPSGEIRIREYVRQDTSNTASYSHIEDNPFTKVADAPLSTFGADVDTASWSNIRRILRARQLPPAGAVRIEEMVNYFPYRYASPNAAPDDVGQAFAAHVDVAGCPWETSHRLVRIGIKGRDVEKKERPAANLVFLLDVSGSMQPENRLPLVLRSMKLLTEQLEARDKVSIVVYAGNSGLVLPPTTGDRKGDILAALERLQAGGSTNGGQGIELAYKTATEAFIPGGINRVILATDGDFNVGVTDNSSLVRLIEEKAKAKVFLSVLGVGDDNLKDDRMEQLADKGNGNYAYLDSDREAKKVLVDQMQGTLQTIAKDLKLQVEFNPLRVASWRLIGYENRVMAAQDFADDKKDAGDVGAGHTVTALYEIVPATATLTAASEGLRYQQGPQPSSAANSGELLTVKIRWKLPEGDVSTLREHPVMDTATSYAQAPTDFKFAAAVAAFGMILRDSPHKGNATLSAVEELAGEGLDFDPEGHRREFLELVRIAKELKK